MEGQREREDEGHVVVLLDGQRGGTGLSRGWKTRQVKGEQDRQKHCHWSGATMAGRNVELSLFLQGLCWMNEKHVDTRSGGRPRNRHTIEVLARICCYPGDDAPFVYQSVTIRKIGRWGKNVLLGVGYGGRVNRYAFDSPLTEVVEVVPDLEGSVAPTVSDFPQRCHAPLGLPKSDA